ncbi:MAG TPA: hypothetical protein VF484_03405 [Candidatus Limnocylindrales bacterium]
MRPGSVGWWGGKVRQARRHVGARVAAGERAALATWLSAAQLTVFDGMHVADQRHGLDVVATLRAGGDDDPEVLLAGLLHDAGKGETGFLPRVAYSLASAYGEWLAALVGWWPGMRRDLARLRAHAETSARMAEAAGCSRRTVELIRWQDEPHDPVAGERLRLADEAN